MHDSTLQNKKEMYVLLSFKTIIIFSQLNSTPVNRILMNLLLKGLTLKQVPTSLYLYLTLSLFSSDDPLLIVT